MTRSENINLRDYLIHMRNSRLDLAERELERVLVIANNNGLPGLTHD